MPSLKQLQKDAKKNKVVWDRFEVIPGDLDNHPHITPIIEKSLGSIDKALEFLRQSDAKEAREFFKKWDSATAAERKVLPLEAFCLSANIKPKVFMGVLMQAVIEHGNTATEMMIAAAEPEIIQKTIKMAKTNRGADERRIILQNRGVLPSPKNQVFNNYGSVDNRKQVANVSVRQLEDDNDKIGEAVDKFNTERMLKPAPEKVEVIDVTMEE